MFSNDPQFFENPFPSYKRLREANPVYWYDPLQCWLVSRYADVETLLKDGRLSSGGGRIAKGVNALPEAERSKGYLLLGILSRMMLFRDQPEHTRLRRAASGSFGRSEQSSMREWLVERIKLVSNECRAEELDVVASYSYPIAVRVICELMKIQPSDWSRVVGWVDDLSEFFVNAMPSVDAFTKACQSTASANDYFQQLYGSHGDDVISRMFGSGSAGQLSRDELSAQAILFLFGGQETTRSALSLMAYHMLTNERVLECVSEGEDSTVSAVSEILRLDSPVQFIGRSAKEDVEVNGTRIRAGESVLLLIGSANRDEEVFAAPNEFQPDRAKAGLVFGLGAHRCIGEFLAKAEIEEAAKDLSGWLRNYTISPSGVCWKRVHGLRGLESLRISRKAANVIAS